MNSPLFLVCLFANAQPSNVNQTYPKKQQSNVCYQKRYKANHFENIGVTASDSAMVQQGDTFQALTSVSVCTENCKHKQVLTDVYRHQSQNTHLYAQKVY